MKKLPLLLLLFALLGCTSNTEEPILDLSNDEQTDNNTEGEEEVVASCSDGIQNGNETGVDCGGDCILCEEEVIEENSMGLSGVELVKVFDLNDIGMENSYTFTDFTADSESNFWMSNPDLGTLHFDGEDWIRRDELSGDLLLGYTEHMYISIDKEDNAWLTESSKIYKFNKDDQKWDLSSYVDVNNRPEYFIPGEYHSDNGIHWFRFKYYYTSGVLAVQDDIVGLRRNYGFGTDFKFDYLNNKAFISVSGTLYEENSFSDDWEPLPNLGAITSLGRQISFVSKGKYWILTDFSSHKTNSQFFYYVDIEDRGELSNWNKKEGKDFTEFLNFEQIDGHLALHDDNDDIWVVLTTDGETNLWKFNAEEISFELVDYPSETIPTFHKAVDGRIYYSVNGQEIWEWIPAN